MNGTLEKYNNLKVHNLPSEIQNKSEFAKILGIQENQFRAICANETEEKSHH
jgi:hypothetical protein